MTICSSRRSGSLHSRRLDTSSAPVIKNHSSSGERSLKMPTVSTLCMARPESISTLSTLKRSLPSTAASTMANLSSAVALTLEASLCGGMPPGTNTTLARSNSAITCSATIMCPWCTGSKVPPKMPIFKSTSLEVEYRLAYPDLVARLGPGPPKGPDDARPLQLVLEPLDALRAAPVGLEREPLDVLPGDGVAAVLRLDPDALPGRPEDAMPPLDGVVVSALLPHPAQRLLEPVAQLNDAFSRGGGDLRGLRERFPQVGPELSVEQVYLVQHYDRGLGGEPGRMEL